MPLGFERLNERQQRPNVFINFIKPLEGPDKDNSEQFLSRIAAQCYPVMKRHYISVMTLEEYEPNPEFLGRNFNAGEVIQLVLKDRQGRWLSMKFVQMVMMHELAHCKQMNHSRSFWTVRNEYARQMEGLWQDGYLGEGMWGRGKGLESGSFIRSTPPDNTQIPEHLCGGSYRRRGRKRKRGRGGGEQSEKLTYAERQQRRIARKFGKHGDGESLGDDELVRGALETMNGGKRSQGKPRVASSKRGRELRAAAALARFDQAKRVKPEHTINEEEGLRSETDSDWEDNTESYSGESPAVISDGRGHDLVKVCDEWDDDEEGAGKEMNELRMLGCLTPQRHRMQPNHGQPGLLEAEADSGTEIKQNNIRVPNKRVNTKRPLDNSFKAVGDVQEHHDSTGRVSENKQSLPWTPMEASTSCKVEQGSCPNAANKLLHDDAIDGVSPPQQHTPPMQVTEYRRPDALGSGRSVLNVRVCPICSLDNDPGSPICAICSHVLRPNLMPNHWRCVSEACRGSNFINAGDAGRCGVCNAQKSTLSSVSDQANHTECPMGITLPETLRWD